MIPYARHAQVVAGTLAAFDAKYWYCEQSFESKGDLYSAALVKALFHGPGGAVPPEEMLAAAGTPGLVSPPPPEGMCLWLQGEDAMRARSISNAG